MIWWPLGLGVGLDTLICMTEDERIERHLEICQRVYERLVAEGRWSCPDSPKPEDVIESEDQKTDL